jgi:hypothetical protein
VEANSPLIEGWADVEKALVQQKDIGFPTSWKSAIAA